MDGARTATAGWDLDIRDMKQAELNGGGDG